MISFLQPLFLSILWQSRIDRVQGQCFVNSNGSGHICDGATSRTFPCLPVCCDSRNWHMNFPISVWMHPKFHLLTNGWKNMRQETCYLFLQFEELFCSSTWLRPNTCTVHTTLVCRIETRKLPGVSDRRWRKSHFFELSPSLVKSSVVVFSRPER